MWTCANIIRNVVARLGIARGRVQLSVQSGAGGGLRGGQVVSPVQVHGNIIIHYIIIAMNCITFADLPGINSVWTRGPQLEWNLRQDL